MVKGAQKCVRSDTLTVIGVEIILHTVMYASTHTNPLIPQKKKKIIPKLINETQIFLSGGTTESLPNRIFKCYIDSMS